MRAFGDWLVKALGWVVAIGLSFLIPILLDPNRTGTPLLIGLALVAGALAATESVRSKTRRDPSSALH